MDRLINWPGAVPLETDLLNTNRNAMIGLGWALQGYLGTGTIVDGFACTQTTVASMSIQVTPGQILSVGNVDNSAYSSLAADSRQIIKQGLLQYVSTLTLTAPTTVGYSINYLIEVEQSDVDGVPVVLSYYNAAVPATAWTGPAGAGTTNNTLRSSSAVVQWKAGAPAATGSQSTPPVDSGCTPLFIVTVAYGQTTITSASISTHPNAPFIQAGAKLPAIPASFQYGWWTWAGAFGGTGNALAATILPAATSYSAGLKVRGNIVTTNTGPMTLNVSGLGAVAAVRGDNVAMIGGECVAGQEAEFTHNGTQFVMSSPLPLSFLNTKYSARVPATTFYVNAATGNDSYNGTSATVGSVINGVTQGPFLTIQGAVWYISSFYSPSLVTVNVAAGTYAGFSVSTTLISSWLFSGVGGSTFINQSTGMGNSDGCGIWTQFAYVSVTGFTVTASIGGIYAGTGAQVFVYNCSIGSIPGNAQLFAYGGGIISVRNPTSSSNTATLTLTGTSANAFLVTSGGQINFGYADTWTTNYAAVTFSGATYTQVLTAVAAGGVYFSPGMTTWSGAPASTYRYTIGSWGSVGTNGSAYYWIPGQGYASGAGTNTLAACGNIGTVTANGTTSNTGIYQ